MSNKPKKDWSTPGIVKSCKTKCKLNEIFISNPTNLHRQNYFIFRNRPNKIITISKGKYYFNLFNDCDIKKTCSCIDSIMKYHKINCLPFQLLVNDENINNPETICECLSSYFIDIGRKLSKDVNCLKNPLTYVDFCHNTSLFSAQVTNTKH